jgi:hypothetical protein
MWGVWLEWDAYNDGHPKPAGRAWLLSGEKYGEPALFECEKDAIQHAAIFREHELRYATYKKDVYTIIQARRFSPLPTWERVACEPDLSALTGFFRA